MSDTELDLDLDKIQEDSENSDEDSFQDDIDNDIDDDDEDNDVDDDVDIDDVDIEDNLEDRSEDENTNCLYEFADKNSSSEEEENLDDIFDDDNDKQDLYVVDDQRITKPFLTKYERVRLIGDRTKQLSGGAKPMIKNVEHLSPKEVAILELEHNVIPLIIERPLPNGTIERWKVVELKHFIN